MIITGNVKWTPSRIENHIIGILENYEIGVDIYEEDAVKDILAYFSNKPYVPFQLHCLDYPDMTGGVCAISYLEEDNLHMMSFDYRR